MTDRKRYSLRRPKSSKALHQAPGTITYIGRKEDRQISLEVIDYNKDSFERHVSNTPEDAFRFEEASRTTWINIDGLSNTAEIEKLGKYYGLHPLIMEDIVNTNQRPKIDEHQDFIIVVVKMLYFQKDDIHKNNGSLVSEHRSFVVGKYYVLSLE